MGEANLTDVELKETLRSLKHNKVSGTTVFLPMW